MTRQRARIETILPKCVPLELAVAVMIDTGPPYHVDLIEQSTIVVHSPIRQIASYRCFVDGQTPCRVQENR
jgi:hypothetical protein